MQCFVTVNKSEFIRSDEPTYYIYEKTQLCDFPLQRKGKDGENKRYLVAEGERVRKGEMNKGIRKKLYPTA